MTDVANAETARALLLCCAILLVGCERSGASEEIRVRARRSVCTDAEFKAAQAMFSACLGGAGYSKDFCWDWAIADNCHLREEGSAGE